MNYNWIYNIRLTRTRVCLKWLGICANVRYRLHHTWTLVEKRKWVDMWPWRSWGASVQINLVKLEMSWSEVMYCSLQSEALHFVSPESVSPFATVCTMGSKGFAESSLGHKRYRVHLLYFSLFFYIINLSWYFRCVDQVSMDWNQSIFIKNAWICSLEDCWSENSKSTYR